MTAAPGTLYAVVDAARDTRLYPLVMQAANQACLFGGEVREPLNRAAPYLVDLHTGEALFRAWRDEGRGQSWGIMCRSGLSLTDLRRRLRHFLVARLPDGMLAHFRFYDPRVFGPYLNSCASEELAAWFDQVSAYLVEDEATGAFHEFVLDEGRLADRAAIS